MPPKAVNHIVDPREREKDINDKFHLLGIYQAFKAGKLPSNKQCDVALNTALESKFLSFPPDELSDEGKCVVRDVKNVIEQAKILFLSKNDGEVLQEFLWAAGHSAVQEAKNTHAPSDRESVKSDTKGAMEGLKTLGNLLITNGEFRKLLSDATVLLRELAGDITQEAANTVRPSEEQVSEATQPDGENVEKPDTSKKKEKEKLQGKAKKKAKKGRFAVAENPSEAFTPTAPAATGSEGGEASASAGAERPADRTIANKSKEYVSEKVPQEQREQFGRRLKKMVNEIQSRDDYYQAIDTLLTLAERYAGYTKDIAQQGTQAAEVASSKDNVKAAENNLCVLIERFANGTSLDDFFESVNSIYREADQDPILKGWFKQTNIYIRKCLEERGYITRDESKSEWDGLYDQGHYLLRERYRGHTNRIVDEVKFLVDQFNEDPLNKAFRESLKRLISNLGGGQHDRLAITKDLYKDAVDVVLPTVFENFRYLPISRIELADPMVDVVIENLVIESDNLMPNVFEFDIDNYIRWGRKTISNRRDDNIMISLSGIQADFRDVSYYIKKKRGFPSLTDVGVMDILLGGEGFGFKINASKAQGSDRDHFFKVNNVSVKIRNFGIKVKRSTHKVLFKMFKSVLYRAIRPTLEKVLEGKIRELFTKGDAFAYEVHTEAKRAMDARRAESEKPPNAYARYLDAVRYRLAERKKQAKAQTSARGATVHIAATDENSVFPDVILPHSLSDKATWYHNIAMAGERWDSPIFLIGKARQSPDIPKPSSISRKSHETADGRMNERQRRHDTEDDGHTEAGRPKERPFTHIGGGSTSAYGEAAEGAGPEVSAAPRTFTEINRGSQAAAGQGNASGD